MVGKEWDKDDGKRLEGRTRLGGGQAGSDILYTKHVCWPQGRRTQMDFAVISAHAALVKREYSAGHAANHFHRSVAKFSPAV
jgi:hypothetical protein